MVIETIDSRIEQIKKNADAINKSYSHLSFAEGVHDGYCRLKCDLRILPSVESKGEWIPVTEGMELPKHDVICCDNDGNVALGYLYFDEEENQIACDRDPYVMFGIVAYMELPEPYQKGGE